MTVSSAVNRTNATGNGAAHVYPYTFKIEAETDLTVIVTDTAGAETTLTLTTDYTVSGVGVQAGGNVTLVNSSQAWLTAGELTTGYGIAILRIMDLTQETDIRNQGPFQPEIHEDQFDRLVMIDQQQQDQLDRSLSLPIGEDPADFDMTIPGLAARAGMMAAYDADGEPTAVSSVIASGVTASAYALTLLDDLSAGQARATLGFTGASGTVATAQIEALAVTAAKIASDAVTTAKILDANVTYAKLAAATIASLTALVAKPGDYKACAVSTAQTGWLLCDGSRVSRTTYADLFAAIGTTFGSGDTSTTFNLPNLKGRFLRGLANYAQITGTGTAASDNATFTAHPYTQSGIRVRLTSGTLSGLSTSTDYWTIYIDENTLAFGSTRANAIAGTKIAISGANSAVIDQWEDPDIASRVAIAPGGATGANSGSYQADGLKAHTHTIGTQGTDKWGASSGNLIDPAGSALSSGSNGGNETMPVNIACFYFIKT